MTTAPTDRPCPHCGERVGEHTIDGFAACCEAQGLNYTLPYADVPDGPLILSAAEQVMVGEITVKAATLDSAAMGKIPVLLFTFYGPGLEPMSKVPTPEYALVGDGALFQAVKQLVGDTVDGLMRAIA